MILQHIERLKAFDMINVRQRLTIESGQICPEIQGVFSCNTFSQCVALDYYIMTLSGYCAICVMNKFLHTILEQQKILAMPVFINPNAPVGQAVHRKNKLFVNKSSFRSDL